MLALRELKEQSAQQLSAANARIRDLESEVAALSKKVQELEAGQNGDKVPDEAGEGPEDRLEHLQGRLTKEQAERAQLLEQVATLENSANATATLNRSLEQQLKEVTEQCAQLADLHEQVRLDVKERRTTVRRAA